MAFATKHFFWGALMATAITGCGDDPVFYTQGPGLNPEPIVRGKQVIAAAIGDDGPALTRKNPALFALDVALTEPQMFRGDLRLDYDDGTLRYQGCAWRIFADASKAAWDGVAYAGDSGEIEPPRFLRRLRGLSHASAADSCFR